LSAPDALELAPANVWCCADETWKQIPDWPHEASTCGRIRSMDRIDASGMLRLGQILSLELDKRPGKGYLYVTLRDGKRRRRVPVAVAVLEAHRGLRPGPGYEACHNHGIRTANHLTKVRWDTREANIADMLIHRLERSVTEAVTGGPENGLECHRPQVRGLRAAFGHLSQLSVTSDRAQGTVRSPLPSNLPSHSISLKPPFHPVRTLILSLRDRLASP
jgi:integrase